MVSIQIRSQYKRTWHRLSNGWWTGHVYYQKNWLSPEAVDHVLQSISSAAELSDLLLQWNGSFALIWQTPERTLAAVDIARAIPLFWSVQSAQISLTDHPLFDAISLNTAQQPPALAQAEFTPGHTTLLSGWQQLQAGDILEIHDRRCYLQTYFSHRRPASSTDSLEELATQFTQLLEAQVDRLIEYAQGREIVIPLSGGYDSRILLALLQQKNYAKLKAFTYGQPDSWEVRIARSVAAALGVEWQFVPYHEALLSVFHSDNWRAYATYASNSCGIPQEQDYFALYQLQQSGWLKAGAIICPGYCGDFQAGSYLPPPGIPLPWRRTKALQNFLFHRFVRYPDAALRQNWQPHLPQADIQDRATYISELEHWVLREYVSKFIINGVRAYEWFDCDWYLPLWDMAFIQFWQNVPNEYRVNMQLYRSVLEEKWFSPLNITFAEDRQSSPLLPSPSDYIPAGWKASLKKLRRSPVTVNINGLHQLVPLIQKNLGWPQTDLKKSVNEMIGHWVHQEINQIK
jgi:asparagine synthase (glutamine-hydrolysing)